MSEITAALILLSPERLTNNDCLEQLTNFYKKNCFDVGHAPDQASYYGNRSAAYMMLNLHQRALEDAQTAIKLDPKFVKGYLRAAKCHMMMGNPSLSTDYYDKVLIMQPGNSQAKEEVL